MQRRVTLSVPARAALLAIPAGLDIDATPASPSAGMPTSLASQKVLGASVLIVDSWPFLGCMQLCPA